MQVVKQIMLSILIPAIPDRMQQAMNTYDRVLAQVDGSDVEVLLFMDNKKRTIGEKREDLKNMASGKYFMFVDDDDELINLHQVVVIARTKEVDVITFKSECRNSDGSKYIVTFGLGNAVEHNVNEDGMYVDINRPPFQMCAWASRFKKFAYPAISYGEDWGWVKQALAEAKTEFHIDSIIHRYNFNPTASMAPTEKEVLTGNVTMKETMENTSNKINVLSDNHLTQIMEATPVKRYAIVNLITEGVHRYEMGQERLMASMGKYAPGNVDCFYFRGEDKVGAPLHADNPYAFKLFAIKKIKDFGYKNVLWLDASIVAAAPFMSIFDRIEEKGLFFEDSGWKAGQWTNDEALRMMEVTRDEAMQMPMFSAGFVGFDFTNPIAESFFQKWWHYMITGAFKGSWENHRHDMSVGSIVANQKDLTGLYTKTTDFFSYIGPGYTPNPDSPFQLLGL